MYGPEEEAAAPADRGLGAVVVLGAGAVEVEAEALSAVWTAAPESAVDDAPVPAAAGVRVSWRWWSRWWWRSWWRDHHDDHPAGESRSPPAAVDVAPAGAPARTATARTSSATRPVTGTVNESRLRRVAGRTDRGAA